MSAIKPIRLGMVGGGRGAFIGEVHRIASRLDNKYCFCAGALSSDPKKSKLSGIELGLDEDRSYGTYEEMIQGESMRDDRIEAVSIVTPNRKLGKIRVVQGEYSQDWLSEPIERDGQKQAYWRTDPEQSGIGGCVGDIGTHAYHLICYVSGLKAEALCADISTFVNGRQLDDNANILLRF